MYVSKIALFILPLAAAPLIKGGVRTAGQSSPTNQETLLIVRGDTPLSGHLLADRIVIPAGVVACSSGDLTLEARSSIEIAGALTCADRGGQQVPQPGIRVSLISHGVITISGVVMGGRGGAVPDSVDRQFEGVHGGQGSTISIQSPLTTISGQVFAGAGGQSGAHTDGPLGGDIIVRGVCVKGPGATGFQLVGGEGGYGGDSYSVRVPAAAGGGGGTVRVEPLQSGTERASFLKRTSDAGGGPHLASGIRSATIALEDEIPGQCAPGSAGAPGADATGGGGQTGSPGAHGTSTSPQGATGGPGGVGGGTATSPITGGTGDSGTDATDCCLPSPTGGKNGGAGGTGGSGKGGKGGTGGQGGNGYFDASKGVYTGPPGDGGPGGPGGTGRGGKGGDGGDGGDGSTAGSGGAAGASGTSLPGDGGDGGDAGEYGRNSTSASPGATGPSGGAQGALGGQQNGDNGTICP